MPAKFGPNPIPRVAKDLFQTFLMAAMSTRQMLSLIRRGDGDVIHLVLESKPNSIRLPTFLDEEDFYAYVRQQLEDLCACENLLVRRKEPCIKCTNTQQPQSTNEEANNTGEKRSWSPQSQHNLTSITPQQHIQQNNVQISNNSALSSPTPTKQPRKSVPGKHFIFYIKPLYYII